jgi:transcriptional regulator with GAF, ATPase, and Fis domain
MKGVNIRLLNKDSGTLDMVASYGFSEDFLNKGPVHKDKSVTRALDGDTVVIRDAATDERVEYREAMKKEGIKSMLVVPVQSGDEVIGVMRLCSAEEREFSEDMILLVEALAHQGGIAIQNASLYLSLQEDKKSLEQDIWSHRSWF